MQLTVKTKKFHQISKHKSTAVKPSQYKEVAYDVDEAWQILFCQDNKSLGRITPTKAVLFQQTVKNSLFIQRNTSREKEI